MNKKQPVREKGRPLKDSFKCYVKKKLRDTKENGVEQ